MNTELAHTRNKSTVSGMFRRNISGWILIFPTLFLFFMIVWRPIGIGITYSFYKMQGATPIHFIGLKNYMDVLTDTNFIQTLFNTIAYVFWSLVIGFPLPFIAAVMVNEMVHLKGFFKVSSYLPGIIPMVATCLIWKVLYMGGQGGFLNNILYHLGVSPMEWLGNKQLTIPLIVISMSWSGFGGAMLMYLAALQGINQELYEAARLDGAGVFGRIKHVLTPHMSGVLLLLAIRQIIGVFQVTEQPLVMTGGGPNGASMSLGLTNYFYAFKYGQFEKSMALGVIVFVLLLGLTVLYFKLDSKTDHI